MSSISLLEEILKLNNIETLEQLQDPDNVKNSLFSTIGGNGVGASFQNIRRHKSNEYLSHQKSDSVIREELSEEDDEDGSGNRESILPVPIPDSNLTVAVTQAQNNVTDENVPEHRCPNADVTACELCKALSILAIVHRNFKLRGETDGGQLVNECSTHIRQIRLMVDKMTPHLSQFDYDECVQANGYRTFVSMAKCGVSKCLHVIIEINEKSRFCTLNSHPDLFERLLDWSRIFRVLAVVMGCLVDFIDQAKNDSLFTSSKEALDKLLSMSKERVNLVGFHGKLLGFQFCKSVRFPLHFVSTFMAAFSEIYKEKGFFRTSITSSKAFIYYWLNPSERADRIAKICGEDPLTFFKEFWLTQEKGIVRIVSNCLGESCDANVEISIPPVRLTVTTKSKKKLTILPPSEYLGIKPVMVRLVSNKVRSGAVGSGKQSSTHDSLSKTLIVHCHGGGFVAQSSNSHLVYLKSFSRGVGAPIVSIDYSLSPEAPYPRALHEAFYGYLWALENAHILGSTAETVIFTGDSAGGLLLTGVTILCIEFGVRVPDGMLLIYTPQLLEPAISPARLLSLADPLIPYPALAACLGAYLGKTFDPATAQLPGCFVDGPWEPEEYSNNECTRKFTTMVLEELDGVTVPQDDWHLSPLIAPDHILSKFPPTSIVTTVFDPCMDDCIELAKRLRGLKVKTTLDVLNSLPHGFLNFGRISEECFTGIEVCFRRLKDFVNV